MGPLDAVLWLTWDRGNSAERNLCPRSVHVQLTLYARCHHRVHHPRLSLEALADLSALTQGLA